MRRVALAVGVLCAVGLSGRSTAQNSTQRGAGAGNLTMPGQVVGSSGGAVREVGTRLPQAAPPAGRIINANEMQRPYDPRRPFDAFKGTGIDPKTVVTPVTGLNGEPITPPDALDELSDRIRAFFVKNPPPPRAAYTPGISRRNRERNDMLWRRD